MIRGMGTIEHILNEYKTIAVVGFSSNPRKAGFYVSEYMQRNGYRIIPVNPFLEEGLGETAYADLADIPEPVEIVQIFRRPNLVVPFVEQAVAIGAKAVWLQLGIANAEAKRIAEEAGLLYVEDHCMLVEHRNL